ncbi:MAG: carbohydrate ABC transporter permease [Propionibacteriaceae bacterium]|jgi:xylobiose transport system permease protein|nr:carbohydrate ABC transporter permease [Propionibacteriaceae bacterium]
MKQRPNVLAGALTPIWLLFMIIPVYVVTIGSFATPQSFRQGGPLSWPAVLTLDNYQTILTGKFPGYMLNTLVIALLTVGLNLLLALPATYAVVRGRSNGTRRIFRVILLGLAIPSQTVLIPLFWIIRSLGLYDSIWAIVLPQAAFGVPMTVLIVSSGMRSIVNELYDAMIVDGASVTQRFFRLALPLSKSPIATVSIFHFLGAWNSFLFPLIFTHSPGTTVMTVGLYNFIGAYDVDYTALFAAVILSATPLLLMYLFARRWLLAGLMGMSGR